jgi:O-antigen biosynthesis protein
MQAQPSSKSARPDVRLEDGRFIVDGGPFLVRGIHYGPWRPGTGPNKQYPYPSIGEIAADFELIRQTGANTVLIYDPPGEVLDLADRYELKVVYVFALDWHSVGGPNQQALTRGLVERVKQLSTKPALLAYLLGNEIGGDILQSRGDKPIVAGLRELYNAVKSVDPGHPISHANWPPARHLDLTFLDFISFNVYPLWPPEVVALGFGRFIETVLRPIAAGKPLLISEFGANTIEAGEEGQARLIRDSWDGLLRAGAAGGIVFEFADEWWKNYNNPARPGDWWTRVPAPDDELRHDQDPEETYGLVKADRTPKPAFAVVSAMFSERNSRETARTFGAVALSAMVVVAAGAWLWARRRHSRRVARPRASMHTDE